MDKVVVFDVDGTLADASHRVHWVQNKPKNWKAFYAALPDDGVHEHIVWLARSVFGRAKIVICSGRPTDWQEQTEAWLVKHKIPYDAIYMRKEGDYRQDSIVKVELLNQIRKDFGEPFIWFDDRNQVVDAIRAQGVKVCQVATGDF